MSIKQELEYKIKDTEYTKTICLKIHSNKGLYIIHRAIIQQLNNSRQNTASTKTRSEVRGGGKKPWKQKGTGRARAGSTRSPLWKGGGVIFGPKNRNYKLKINQKEKHLALRTLLYNKFKHTIVIPDTWAKIDKPNTRYMLEQINLTTKNISKKLNILIIVIEKNPNLYLSIRNLKNINIIQADQINILSLLKAQKLLITANSLDKINEVYGE